MRPKDRIQGEPIWTPQDAADTLTDAREQPCEVGVPAETIDDADAVWRQAAAVAEAAKQTRRDKYAAVFARHAYQGGWSKGVVKCRCGWNTDIETDQDKHTLARQSFELWGYHLAEVVVK